ncbi:hypothetical protein BC332_17843 [Capsicum chinense]|nr:hypothetical protein BC332_17843 [Capsicum chinense]
MNILFHPLTPLILWNMSIDPTKLLDPRMPSYTLTIYNLYLVEKSKFKNYDSLLGNRFAGCQARANNLGSVLENGDAICANGTLVKLHDENESKVANEKVSVTTSSHFIWPTKVAALPTEFFPYPGFDHGPLVKGGAASSTTPQPILVHFLLTEQVKVNCLIDTGAACGGSSPVSASARKLEDPEVGPSLPGSANLLANADSGGLPLHVAPEKIALFLDQSLKLLWEDPIMNFIKRCEKEKDDKIGQNNGVEFSSISARDSPRAIAEKSL